MAIPKRIEKWQQVFSKNSAFPVYIAEEEGRPGLAQLQLAIPFCCCRVLLSCPNTQPGAVQLQLIPVKVPPDEIQLFI